MTGAFGYLFNSAGYLTLSGNITLGPIVLYQGAFGIAIDLEGNVSYISANGFGVGAGGKASVGVSGGYSPDAQTNNDLKGPFSNVSAGAGLGPSVSADVFFGNTNDGRPVTGGGFTVGAGVGSGFTVTRTDTTVTPLFNLKTQRIDPAASNVP